MCRFDLLYNDHILWNYYVSIHFHVVAVKLNECRILLLMFSATRSSTAVDILGKLPRRSIQMDAVLLGNPVFTELFFPRRRTLCGMSSFVHNFIWRKLICALFYFGVISFVHYFIWRELICALFYFGVSSFVHYFILTWAHLFIFYLVWANLFTILFWRELICSPFYLAWAHLFTILFDVSSFVHYFI